MNIADIGRAHLRDALTGKRSSCNVDEWLGDDGHPVKIYWLPLTGAQQKRVEEASTNVDRTCMMLKVRALDEAGAEIFADVPLVSLVRDYDYSVVRAIVYIMASDMGQDADDRQEEIEKE